MGKVLSLLRGPFLFLLAIAGCAFPDTRWEKPGADEKATAEDLVTCRHAAQQEAFNTAPVWPVWAGRPYGYGYGYMGGDRFYDESRLTRFCMRNKGYELVTVPPPQTRAPAPAPASTDK